MSTPQEPADPTGPPPAQPARTGPGGPEVTPWPFVGMIGMACVFFVVAATPVAVPGIPWWAIVGLLVLWGAGMVLAVQWWTPHPVALAWLPLGLAVVWFATLLAGARWLDWV